jgi:hypothetical protein
VSERALVEMTFPGIACWVAPARRWTAIEPGVGRGVHAGGVERVQHSLGSRRERRLMTDTATARTARPTPNGSKGRGSAACATRAAQRVSLAAVLAAGGGLIETLAPQPL